MKWSKVGKELRRVRTQVVRLAARVWFYGVVAGANERRVRRESRVSEGQVALTDEVAVFLIYPLPAICESHLVALDFLVGQGIAPLVVSNAPLDPTARDALAARSWRILERPNIGYDFGGYRDGLAQVEASGLRPERVYLFNDSVWFPFNGGAEWIAAVRGSEADFIGAAAEQGSNRPSSRHQGPVSLDVDPATNATFHYNSYALAFSSRLVASDDFKRYWRRLGLPISKHEAIRLGEIGLSRFIIGCGYSHSAVIDAKDVTRWLDGLDADGLREVARRLLVVGDDRLLRRIQAAVADGADRQDLLNLIRLAIARQGFSYVLGDRLCRTGALPFVKKRQAYVSAASAQIVQSMLEASDDPNAGLFLREAVALQKDRLPAPGDVRAVQDS